MLSLLNLHLSLKNLRRALNQSSAVVADVSNLLAKSN